MLRPLAVPAGNKIITSREPRCKAGCSALAPFPEEIGILWDVYLRPDPILNRSCFMGARISYYRIREGISLRELLARYYTAFRSWCLDADEESRQEFGEPVVDEHLMDYLLQHPGSCADLPGDPCLTNELLGRFITGTYGWAPEEEHILLPVSPFLNKWRYENSNTLVAQTQDARLMLLWNYIIKGRSLVDNADCQGIDPDFTIGFLDAAEQQELKTLITQHFGDLAANAGLHVAEFLDGEPPGAGLGYVLQAMEEASGSVLVAQIE